MLLTVYLPRNEYLQFIDNICDKPIISEVVSFSASILTSISKYYTELNQHL